MQKLGTSLVPAIVNHFGARGYWFICKAGMNDATGSFAVQSIFSQTNREGRGAYAGKNQGQLYTLKSQQTAKIPTSEKEAGLVHHLWQEGPSRDHLLLRLQRQEGHPEPGQK